MGKNCSCLKGVEEENQANFIQPFEFDKNQRRILEEEKSELFRLDIDQDSLIKLQNAIRGRIDRKKVKAIYISNLNQIPINDRKSEELYSNPGETIHRLEVKEIHPSKVPDYSTHATRNVENMLGPFVYADTFNDECNTHKLGAVEMENGAIYIGEWSDLKERHGKGCQI